VTGGNVTYVMDRLEQQGLVYRERSEDDRRVIQAKLTPEGHGLVNEVFQGHADFIEHLTRHLEPAERLQATALLKKLGRGVAGDDV
jgi:MarR family 2-MHQ and catechol resistance regulon transcriptional repressor